MSVAFFLGGSAEAQPSLSNFLLFDITFGFGVAVAMGGTFFFIVVVPSVVGLGVVATSVGVFLRVGDKGALVVPR